MVSEVRRDPESNASWAEIWCDECADPAPPAGQILEGHGLVNMGWHCSGGVHLCPKCNKENTSD